MRWTAMLAAAFLAAATPASAQTKWQMPTPYPPGNFHTANISRFADEVKQATGGKLDIIVHPAGTLLPLPQIKRAVQSGDVQIGEIFLPAFENEDALFGADAVPFLVRGYPEAKKLWDASKPLLTDKLKKQGIRLLYAVAWPPQGLYTNKRINTVDDLKGLKFRSYGPSAAKFGEMIGAAVSTIQAAELSEALRTGRVNAMLTSSATGVDSKIWETDAKYYLPINAWVPKNAVIVNEKAFAALDAAAQQAVLNAAAAAEQRGWEESIAVNRKAVETLTEHGVVVDSPPAPLVFGLVKIGLKMAEDWEKRAGPEGAALLAPFKKQ